MYCLSMFKDSGDAMPAIYRARVEKLYPENRSGNKLPTVRAQFDIRYCTNRFVYHKTMCFAGAVLNVPDWVFKGTEFNSHLRQGLSLSKKV